MNGEQAPTAEPRNITMNDVADCAGVSIKSVSRVINNEPHVSARLRARVEQAIAQLGWVPDTAARSLAGARSFVIGVMFDNPSPNYTMKVVAGVYAACIENQYHLRFDNIDTSGNDAAAITRRLDEMFRLGRCDGFVLTPPLCDHAVVLDYLEARGIRYSRIAPAHDRGRAPTVVMDDHGAGGDVAALFHRLGHRRVGVIDGPVQHTAALARREGFIARMVALNPEAIVSDVRGDFTFQSGIVAGRELLSARRHPTAIFATNDDMAAGVIAACNQMGFSVPGDVSVCGFDDSWVASAVFPYLTTVHQPIEAMAHAAAMMMIERKPPAIPPLRQLDHHLIERDSVRGLA